MALARALARTSPRMQVQVCERAPGLYKRGAGLALHPNGTAALRYIDPDVAERLAATSIERAIISVEEPRGTELARQQLVFGPGPKAADQSMDALVPWHEMYRLLAESLEDGVLQNSKHFKSLQLPTGVDEGRATVTFMDGSSCEARVVVGADGLLSPVREAWLGDGGPQFDSRVVFRGQARTSDIKKLPGWEGINARICPMGDDTMCMVYQLHGDVTVWAVNAGYEAAKACGVDYTPYDKGAATRASLMDPEDAGARCFAEVKKMTPRLPECVRQVLDVADPSTTTIHGDYVRYPESYPEAALGRGPVTLVGDAFHPLKVAGVGANLAFEDAVVLAHHLSRLGPCEAALRAYELDRLPRIRGIAQYNIESMNRAAKTTGEEFLQLKKRLAEYERDVVFMFDHPCLEQAAGAQQELVQT